MSEISVGSFRNFFLNRGATIYGYCLKERPDRRALAIEQSKEPHVCGEYPWRDMGADVSVSIRHRELVYRYLRYVYVDAQPILVQETKRRGKIVSLFTPQPTRDKSFSSHKHKTAFISSSKMWDPCSYLLAGR